MANRHQQQPVTSTLSYLAGRQCGTSRKGNSPVQHVKNRINAEYSGMFGLVSELQLAVDHTQWAEIGRCVGSLVTTLLDSGGMDPPFTIPSKNKQQRDMFIALGGVKQLLRVFEPPLSTADARGMTETGIKRRAEVWNEIMVMLREIFYSTPLLADKVTSSSHIVFLFTMLHHQCVFENTMNLLEEILATRSETFSIAEVPKLYELVDEFSTRQLAHFCRVLALILFESEDRQIMESSKVLKSFELLNLRKDRMTKASFNIVELNQSLVIGMPNFLNHLIVILQILNYGPTVSEYVRHNGHVPLSSDILAYISGRDGRSEWRHFSKLHEIASSQRTNTEHVTGGPRSSVTASSGWGRAAPSGVATAAPVPVAQSAPPSSVAATWPESTEEDERVLRDIMNAFSANRSDEEGLGGHYDPISSILNVMQVAHSIGVAPSGVENYDGVMQMLINMSDPDAVYRQRGGNRNSRRIPPPGSDDREYYSSFTPSSARHELQFHAMVLAPHQVEILFVMCTLLCGRRKIQVQDALEKHGLSSVLLRMNNRMSWYAPPYEGPNPYEHIHGPSCECNPESALRVQFLRLVHNFYDRDFMNNPIKESMLSAADIAAVDGIKSEMVMSRTRAEDSALSSFDGVVVVPRCTSPLELPTETGLIGQLAAALMKEPSDSVYQFWLCSCLECFLRGQSEESQTYFARSGVLSHLVKHVIDHNTVRQTESVLQTSFDLIGELIKYNPINIELLQVILCSAAESKQDMIKPSTASDNTGDNIGFSTPAKKPNDDSLTEFDDIYGLENLMTESVLGDSFSSFIKVVMDNIVDSNVFLRSLYLSMEEINAANIRLMVKKKKPMSRSLTPVVSLINTAREGANDSDFGTVNDMHIPAAASFITHSWYQYAPNIASPREKSSAGTFLGLSEYRGSLTSADEIHHRSPRKIISNIGSGLLGAFKGLKNSVLGQKSAGGGESTGASDCSEINSDSCDVDADDRKSAGARSDSSFKTAPDSEVAAAANDNLPTSFGVTAPTSLLPIDKNVWFLAPEIQKLSTFMIDAKTRILLRLMSIVTLRSINHENICCMNTAVLIMLFDYRRGILAETLTEVRQLAVKFGKCYCRFSNAGSGHVAATPGSNIGAASTPGGDLDGSSDAATPAKQEPNARSVNSYLSQTRDGCMFCKPYRRLSIKNDESRSKGSVVNESENLSLVMVNFRQLLWYWKEYYFRRGRDRLSLEFSSHIPFSVWQEIVDVLCKDDGSPTSLVSEPLAVPESPYAPSAPIAQSVLKGSAFEDQHVFEGPRLMQSFRF